MNPRSAESSSAAAASYPDLLVAITARVVMNLTERLVNVMTSRAKRTAAWTAVPPESKTVIVVKKATFTTWTSVNVSAKNAELNTVINVKIILKLVSNAQKISGLTSKIINV